MSPSDNSDFDVLVKRNSVNGITDEGIKQLSDKPCRSTTRNDVALLVVLVLVCVFTYLGSLHEFTFNERLMMISIITMVYVATYVVGLHKHTIYTIMITFRIIAYTCIFTFIATACGCDFWWW